MAKEWIGRRHNKTNRRQVASDPESGRFKDVRPRDDETIEARTAAWLSGQGPPTMIDINGVNPASVPQPVAPVAPTHAGETAAQPVAQDVIEISTAARLAAMVKDLPDVRADLVARVKAQIQAGTYETPERIERAVDGLMADLLG